MADDSNEKSAAAVAGVWGLVMSPIGTLFVNAATGFPALPCEHPRRRTIIDLNPDKCNIFGEAPYLMSTEANIGICLFLFVGVSILALMIVNWK